MRDEYLENVANAPAITKVVHPAMYSDELFNLD
jgi:hypothetical protein